MCLVAYISPMEAERKVICEASDNSSRRSIRARETSVKGFSGRLRVGDKIGLGFGVVGLHVPRRGVAVPPDTLVCDGRRTICYTATRFIRASAKTSRRAFAIRSPLRRSPKATRSGSWGRKNADPGLSRGLGGIQRLLADASATELLCYGREPRRVNRRSGRHRR